MKLLGYIFGGLALLIITLPIILIAAFIRSPSRKITEDDGVAPFEDEDSTDPGVDLDEEAEARAYYNAACGE